MIYHLALTIPANTPIAAPVEDSIDIGPGVVKQVFIVFPSGPQGLAGVQVWIRERQLYPSNPDEWFVNNEFTYQFAENLTLEEHTEQVTLRGYNADTLYEHTIRLILTVTREAPDTLSQLLAARPVLGGGGGSAVGG